MGWVGDDESREKTECSRRFEGVDDGGIPPKKRMVCVCVIPFDVDAVAVMALLWDDGYYLSLRSFQEVNVRIR